MVLMGLEHQRPGGGSSECWGGLSLVGECSETGRKGMLAKSFLKRG